jgi:uncharacterized repeat protein (TIGR03803 family)
MGRRQRLWGALCLIVAASVLGDRTAAAQQMICCPTIGVLHAFADPPVSAGAVNPHVTLMQGSDGFLYGATQRGGTYDHGALFRSSLAGEVTLLYSFNGSDLVAPDGMTPGGSLTEHADGSFYGVTEWGGSGPGGWPGYGTVFRLNADRTLTTLHTFTFLDYDNGINPVGRLLEASNGFLYGVTTEAQLGVGTIFKLDPASGSLTRVHTFSSAAATGGRPNGGLLEVNGVLYGTTRHGGAFSGGTIYKLDPSTGAVTVAHSFASDMPAGYQPHTPLTAAPDGYLYGTTSLAGAAAHGAIYRFDPSTGAVTAVAAFGTSLLPGRGGSSELVVRDGALWGTTVSGGTDDRGTIFMVHPVVTKIYSLDASLGRAPRAGLMLGANGHLYGLASQEGPLGGGTLFRLHFPDPGPAIDILSPAATSYELHQPVFASYRCTDPSGVATCNGTVVNGAAIDTSTLGPKAFTVDASDTLGNSNSRQVAYTVMKASTTTTLRSSSSPSSVLDVIYLTATVNTTAGVNPTGHVHFFDGPTHLGASTLNNRSASITTTALGPGGHTLYAEYVGDGSFEGSTSGSTAHVVSTFATSTVTALVMSPTPSATGAPVSLIAIVAPLGSAGGPSGVVEFLEGTTSLGTATLTPVNGYQIAVLTTSTLAAGTHMLVARYAGDAIFGRSQSAPAAHTVYSAAPPAATTTTIMTTPNPTGVGEPFWMIVEVRSPGGVPSGWVYLMLNGTVWNAHRLATQGGVARAVFPLSGGLPQGLYVISAVYPGFAPFAGSSSQNMYHCVACTLVPGTAASAAPGEDHPDVGALVPGPAAIIAEDGVDREARAFEPGGHLPDRQGPERQREMVLPALAVARRGVPLVEDRQRAGAILRHRFDQRHLRAPAHPA